MGVSNEGALDHALANPGASTVIGDKNNQVIHPEIRMPGADYYDALSGELVHKGFLVTSTEDVFQWARTGSLWWMTFGLACCPARPVSYETISSPSSIKSPACTAAFLA